MTKWRKLRGGFIPAKTWGYTKTANRLINSPLGQQAKQYAIKVGKRYIKSALGAAGVYSLSFGTNLIHNLGQGTKKSKMPLIGGEIRGGSTGTISETHYACRPKRKPSKALVNAMAQAQRLELNLRSSYRCYSGTSTQGVADISSEQTASYAYNKVVFGGDVGAYKGVMRVITDGVGGSGAGSTARVLFKNCYMETAISNFGLHACIVDLYECVARHDLAPTPEMSSNFYVYSPSVAWNVGLNNTTSFSSTTTGNDVSDGLIAYNTYGSQPYDSPLFNVYWKVAAKLSITIPAGGGHKHVSDYSLMRVLEAERYRNSSLLQGVTRNIMLVVRGMPGYDVNAASYGQLAPADIVVNHTMYYKAYAMTGSAKKTMSVNTTTWSSADTTKEVDVDSPTYENQVNN